VAAIHSEWHSAIQSEREEHVNRLSNCIFLSAPNSVLRFHCSYMTPSDLNILWMPDLLVIAQQFAVNASVHASTFHSAWAKVWDSLLYIMCSIAAQSPRLLCVGSCMLNQTSLILQGYECRPL
jgi:hypothetical protein